MSETTKKTIEELSAEVNKLRLELFKKQEETENFNINLASNLDCKLKEIKDREFNNMSAINNQLSILEKSIRTNTGTTAEYAEMLNVNTISQLFTADQDMQQELFKIDVEVNRLLSEKSVLVKRQKELEVEIKIVEAHNVMTAEFAMLKNAPQRDASRRLASESERTEKAEVDSSVETIYNELLSLKNSRETVLAALNGLRSRIEISSSIFRFLGR